MSAALTFGQATRVVARRELRERLRDRSFAISTVITVVILAAVLFAPRLLGDDGTFTIAVEGSNAEAVATAVRTQAEQADVTVRVRDYPDRAAATRAVDDGDLDAYVATDGIVVESDLDDQLGVLLQAAHQQVASVEKLRADGIDPGAVQSALQVAPLLVDPLNPLDARAEQRGQIAFVGSIVLYGQIIGYCMWVAFGIVEEKSSRVVELILSAISTKALLAGKILGIGLLGLGQLALIAVCGLTIGNATGMLDVSGELLAPVGYVLLWFVLGYSFYSAVFAASAARVSRQEELQNVITPVNMLIMVSFFATFYVYSNPDTLISRVLAVVPPFSTLCAPIRMARGSAPWWEVGAALALMAAAIGLLVVVGARIYEGGILRMGAKVPLRDAWLGARRTAGETAGASR